MISHPSIRRIRPVKAAAVFAALALAACTGQPGTPVAPGSYPPNTPLGGTCKAGFYTCQLPTATPLGAPCSCPGLGAASYGRVYLK
ncbi:hypothetical protein AA23498_3021 [Acetobacter nitrogenifigens DSM 23921 = NBRC 105050]|uniref:Lipoprotein n=1 Tax=Acetobacter nitrogenifigens DSM 23921 = NBRC 105050 TaxID=1120919 RepID=A0A511XA18_9PROT|nr:hypothetical protein [Acetobacter nitrogenifigens]GBQ97879.1 hypothetical protein AA23498_3021 [Acetobacter nitrogenifigens DSM 23921 = NBRC 105050]GEN59772.1 hypothetical protein ANI02nite_16560 [Acetobacter nitrogenifigens DSM 23921 = NBRC 105050]